MDLRRGSSRRVLDGHPSTQVEPNVDPKSDGLPLRRPDGRKPQFAADGIALSADGQTLFWQALTGTTLYSVPTRALQDAGMTPDRLAREVRTVGKTHVADGLWIDARSRFFVTNPETSAVEVADRPGGRLTTLVQDPRLRWPDTFAQGPDGALYVTTSHIQDSPWFKPDAKAVASELWRIKPR